MFTRHFSAASLMKYLCSPGILTFRIPKFRYDITGQTRRNSIDLLFFVGIFDEDESEYNGAGRTESG